MNLIQMIDTFMVGRGQTMRISAMRGALRVMFGVQTDAGALVTALRTAGFSQVDLDTYAVNWNARADRLVESFEFDDAGR